MAHDDLKVIKRLEEIWGKKFKRSKKLGHESGHSFRVDKNGRVIGIRIFNANFSEIPDELFELDGLEDLRIFGSYITELPEEIQVLNRIEVMYVSSGHLNYLPPEIGNLKKIRFLNLSKNKLVSIPEQIRNLENLENLNLGNNALISIPPEIQYLPKLVNIHLGGNKLTSPPQEVANEGIHAIRDYFSQLEKEKGHTQHLFEAKLLIIGDGGTGKTTFLRKIRDPEADLPKNKDTTRGIEVHTWNFNTTFPINGNKTEITFNVNLWDFGGQKLYQGTHQIFFSDKSYYVLVDATREQATDFSYWLNTVQQLAGNDSSVLILQNIKHGHVPSFDRRGYSGHFGKIIKDVVALDLSKDQKKLLLLQEMVKNHLKQLPEIGNELPGSWVGIRQDLTTLTEKFITFDRFRGICKKYDITDASMIRTLSGYYTRIGAFTHYLNDPLLRDRIYLNSNWLVKTVYEVLDNKMIQEKKGRLTRKQVESIWSKSALDFEVDRLAQLMNKFGLMYKVPGKNQYVVPEHLPKEQPYEEWPGRGQALHFVYVFDKYMPPGLMSRIIVALHRFIKNHKYVWHQGVNVEVDGAKAEIVESYGTENSFWIRIVGENKIELLSVIRERFEELLAPFKNLNYDQLVPCSCKKCAGSDIPEFHRYKNLQKREVKESGSQCVGSGKLVPVEDLLSITIQREEYEESEQVVDLSSLKIIQLFLASSSELEDDRREVEIWVNRENKRLAKRNLFLELVLWEDFLDAMSKTRLQDEYNKALVGCEIVICLFETKLGAFTKEEFMVAYNSFKSGNKPHYLYTYFKESEIKTTDMAKLKLLMKLHDFKEELQKMGHYPTHYTSILDLKEQLGNQLEKILEELV